jgi:hypothetical protein
MNSVIRGLLKNGITGLAQLEEDYFKKNVLDALSLKLNEELKYVYETSSKDLLNSQQNTSNTPELREFVNFVETFKPGKYIFKNNSVLNIDEREIKILKELFDLLSDKSRKIMTEQIFKDSESFKNHIEFYNKAKGLLK